MARTSLQFYVGIRYHAVYSTHGYRDLGDGKPQAEEGTQATKGASSLAVIMSDLNL